MLPGAQPRFGRDRGAEASLTPGTAARGAPEPAALRDYRQSVLSTPNVVGKHAHKALTHEIKPRSACTAEEDLDEISLPGFLLSSTRLPEGPPGISFWVEGGL